MRQRNRRLFQLLFLLRRATATEDFPQATYAFRHGQEVGGRVRRPRGVFGRRSNDCAADLGGVVSGAWRVCWGRSGLFPRMDHYSEGSCVRFDGGRRGHGADFGKSRLNVLVAQASVFGLMTSFTLRSQDILYTLL